MNSKLRFGSHIAHIIDKAARTLYGLKTLRSHGLTGQSLWDVTRATLIAQILYATPVWWGFLNLAEKDRLLCLSSVNPSAMASYLATFKVLVVLLNPWNLIYLDLFVQIPNMFCFAFSHLKRPPAIIYGNGLTTSPSPNRQ